MKHRRLFHFLIAAVFVSIGAFGMYALTASKPEMKMRKPVKMAPLVRVLKIEVGPQPIVIRGEGTVEPLREITLVPQVDGKVIYVSPALVNGGCFKKGETLLRIDPQDYKLAVTLAKARVKNSESRLRLAEEEAAVAREEWRLLYEGTPKAEHKPPPLVAKEPQLQAARAQLAADRADLQKAMLNLQRTELKAPFDGRVSRQNVGVGQYVTPGQAVATIYDTEAAEIVVPLETEDLFWIKVPEFTDGEGPGSKAVVSARLAGKVKSWKGEVVRAEGELDERTRMVNIIIRVEKPYETRPPLAVGLFVTVEIEGRTLPQAAAIPRAALHEDDTVWVVDGKGRLRFRKVDVAIVQDEKVIARSGLHDGDYIVLSHLKAVSDGMLVSAELQNREDRT